jgi:hypothetical protein
VAANAAGSPAWKDVSSYERGERGTKEPSAWALDLADGVRVTVHRWRGLHGWHVTCPVLKVDAEVLDAGSATDARKEALSALRNRARVVLSALSVAPDEPR